MKHNCAAPHCSIEINDGQLMCPRHWVMLPNHIQRAVNKGWKLIRARHLSTASQRVAITTYRRAVNEAKLFLTPAHERPQTAA